MFNLRVSNHPSYFAGGILVHNCHILYKSMAARLAKDKGIIIGLTATPFTKGLGRHYKAIVSVRTTNQLIGEGFLVPFKCWAAAEPDMTKAKRGDVDRFGEWTDEFAREQSMPIIGDVVAEYEKHGNGKKFICFGVDVAHCEALQKQFIGAGINTSLYTYLTCDEEREMLIGERGEFRKPDSSVRGLISVAALSRGFDVPDVHCILMCRPLRRSFAEFIQVLGRGLRPYPGKEFAVLLDLAGNMMRHHGAMEEFFEFGAQELDDGKPKPKETKALEEKKEKKPIKCPQCAFVFKAGRQCPQCGYIFPSRNSVEHEQGELKEFKSGQKMARADKMTLHAELSHIALKKGYKLGWIAHAYRWFTGVWPQGVSNGTIPPSPQTLAALRRRNKEQGKPEKRQTELDLFL